MRPCHRIFLLIACALTGALSSACAPGYRYRPFPPRVTPALGEMRTDHARIRVFFGTDRRTSELESENFLWGAERSRELAFGACDVSIPARHGLGRLETQGLIGSSDPARHVTLLSGADPSPRSEFIRQLRASVSESRHRELLIYVHGFYTPFEEAARRTAQIAHDLTFDGPALLYSWPTQGALMGYLADMTNIEWSEPHFVEFLATLIDHSGAQRIHIIAHSMGARLTARAVQGLLRERPNTTRPLFAQIMLAAADIDAEIFYRDYACPLAEASERLTIYFSHADSALGRSQWLQKYPRLGIVGGMGTLQPSGGRAYTGQAHLTPDIARCGRIELIDATEVDQDFLGHSYYSESPSVLRDISAVIAGTPPCERRLTPVGDAYRIVPPPRSRFGFPIALP